MTDDARQAGGPGDLHDRMTAPAPSWSDLRAQVDHSDMAYQYLNSSPFNGDPQVTKAMIEAATVHAYLAVADKLEELNATIKFSTNKIIESQAKLDSHIQTAAQHLHKDAQELKAHLRVIRGEQAA